LHSGAAGAAGPSILLAMGLGRGMQQFRQLFSLLLLFPSSLRCSSKNCCFVTSAHCAFSARFAAFLCYSENCSLKHVLQKQPIPEEHAESDRSNRQADVELSIE
jgi:hypothetical protein